LHGQELLVAQGFMTYDTMPHMARAFLDEYRETVIDESNADVIILEHPFLVDFVGDRPFIYDSHNAETLSHGQRFGFDTSRVFACERVGASSCAGRGSGDVLFGG
jgi:hypothetical protein